MNNSIEVPSQLRFAILFNAANDLLLSISLFFFPVFFIESAGWVDFDPFAFRLIDGGLSAVAIESIINRNGDIEKYKSLLNIKVYTLGVGFAGTCMALLQSDHAPIIAEWILFGGLLIPLIQLGYWRVKIGKLTE